MARAQAPWTPARRAQPRKSFGTTRDAIATLLALVTSRGFATLLALATSRIATLLALVTSRGFARRGLVDIIDEDFLKAWPGKKRGHSAFLRWEQRGLKIKGFTLERRGLGDEGFVPA